MIDPRNSWNTSYAKCTLNNLKHRKSSWLERWHEILNEKREEGKCLELGCGCGHDSAYLARLGYNVIATDFSEEALKICHQLAPSVTHLQVDVRQSLPFPNNSFHFVVASLSLHYFSWQQTEAIEKEIRRCLKNKGVFFVRLNSTNDVYHGAVGHKEIEPNLYLVHGKQKRFFDRDSIDTLFNEAWRFLAIEEMVVGKKVLWEIILKKR